MVDERDVRAAVYVRVSTQEQVEGTSLDVQRHTCRSHAERLGWRVAAEFADEGVSGSLGNRPALDELLTACRGGLIDVVVVHRLDRFGRSLRHLSNTLGDLDEIGVQFVSVQEAFDSKGSAGRLQRNILSSVAQFEREQMVNGAGRGFVPRSRPAGGLVDLRRSASTSTASAAIRDSSSTTPRPPWCVGWQS